MEILERNPWKLDHDCTGRGNGGKGCGSRLRMSRDDLRYWPGVGGDTWGSSDPAVAFKCPVCGVVTDILEAEWPARHRSLIEFTTGWRDAPPATEQETGHG